MRRSPLLLVILLSGFAVAPLLAPGYFLRAHDAAHNLFWLVEFDQGLRDGFLWPRWAPDHALGYGYPLFTFYAPLAFYIAEAFHLLGASIAGAVKITWALAFIVSGVTMYRFANRLWGKGPGFVAALLYVYAPYHLVNIYVRAALAEFVAYALFPWALHAFWELLQTGGRRNLAWAAFSFGLILLTHSVTILIFPPMLALLILYWLALAWRRSRRIPWHAVGRALIAGLLGVAFAAIFVLPALLESNQIVQAEWLTTSYDYRSQFIYLHQLLSHDWGFGNALPGPEDGMSQQVGLWLIALGLAAVPLALRYRRQTALLVGFVGAGLLSLFLTQQASAGLWAVLSPFTLIQFPFRWLAMAALFLSLSAGGVLAALSAGRRPFSPAFVAVGLAVILASYPYTQPQHTPVSARNQSSDAVYDFEIEYPDMRGSTAFAPDGPPTTSPKLTAYETGSPLPLAAVIAGDGQVETIRHGAGSERVRVDARTPVTVQFYTYWYPGWRAAVRPFGDADAGATFVEPRPEGPQGLITLDLPAGDHDISIRFTNTPLRTLAATLSILAAILLIALFFGIPRRKAAPPPPSTLL